MPQSTTNEPIATETSQPAAIAPPLAQAAPTELRGSFVDGEHPTRGMVQIVTQGGGRILELDEAFATSTSGPDLFVILHRLPDVIGSTTPPAYPIQEGDYVVLAPLRSYTGAQTYEIPDNINLDEFRSVAIWCRRFNATFGAATLEPQG
ncbi:MAG: DM13 domain-containing protein [Leptolyngbyaceae cyanobacterium SM1_3_5]|nr:DM13 domain-containing protein [Leptolyngbyaceae cyanobacterium SM1_3_5]